MKLLVTGGAGFIGSHFVRLWLQQHPQDTITILDALTYAGNLANLHDIPTPRITFIHGDFCDPETVRRAMEGVEVVVHFGAETHVDRSIIGGRTFVLSNVLGTQTLLDEALRRGSQIRRFHHVSTDEVYGALSLEDTSQFDERRPYAPSSPYSASKAASDHLVRAYFHTYQLPITISNCSNNYGSYHFPEKFIPRMIVNALNDQPLPVYGDGLHVRDWIHAIDHCRGIMAILERGRVGETYCLGGNAEPSNLSVAKQILAHLNKPESLITFVEDRKGHDRRYSINDRKAREELGFEPSIRFEDGLKQTIDWFVQNPWWWKPLLDRAKLQSNP